MKRTLGIGIVLMLVILTLRETVLVEGEDIQTAMRWQDYTQTAIDPTDDCTIWYVGDYIKKALQAISKPDRSVSPARVRLIAVSPAAAR